MPLSELHRILERAEPGARKAHKRHVMACALACFEAGGLDATTIEEIRASADSSIGSIYHHFGNKDGLVAALFFAGLDDQAARAEPALTAAADTRGVVQACVREYLHWVSEHPQFARFLYMARATVARGPAADDLARRNRARLGSLQERLARGVEAGEVLELPRETYLPLLIGPSEIYCRAWLSERVKMPPVQHMDVFARAAWRAIAAREGD